MQLVELAEPRRQPAINHPNNVRDEEYSQPRQLQQLDSEMSEILHDTATSIEEKWSLYHQALQRYLGFIKRMRAGPSIDNLANDDTDEPTDVVIDHPPIRREVGSSVNQQYIGCDLDQKRKPWKGSNYTRQMVTRRNAKPSDLVSPLHTPKRKKNIERRYPFKDNSMREKKRYDTAAPANRRNNDFDIRRALTSPAFSSPADESILNPTGHPADYQPGHSEYNDLIRPCSVRVTDKLNGWTRSDIKK